MTWKGDKLTLVNSGLSSQTITKSMFKCHQIFQTWIFLLINQGFTDIWKKSQDFLVLLLL